MKFLPITLILVLIGGLTYYHIVLLPQQVRIKCFEIAKDYHQKGNDEGVRQYGSEGYFINQEMYNKCTEEAGISSSTPKQ